MSACSYRRHGEGRISLCPADYWHPSNIEAELLTLGPCTPNGNRQAGDVSGVPAAGHRAWVSSALSPAFGVRHSVLTCWVLIFGVVFILYKFWADAFWEQLLCYSYSAEDFFFFNLGLQINRMRKVSRLFTGGSAPNACGCCMGWCKVWMREASKTVVDCRFDFFFFLN